MFKKFTKEKTDEKIEKFKKKWNNLNEADRKKDIINLRNSIFDTIEDRNPNNLIS
jgi:ribosomal protein S25